MDSINYISLPSATDFGTEKTADLGITFSFDDDIQIAETSNSIASRSPASTEFSRAPTVALPRPASCVITKNSAKAELITARNTSAPYHENYNKFNGFIKQIFEVNYDVTMTNCNLVSKHSDLQLENINLLETIAKLKASHSQEISHLQEALKKTKKDNYEMSMTNSDLTLSNVDYRKEVVNLRDENCRLKQNKQGIESLSQNFNEKFSQDLMEKLSSSNEDLSAKLQHITNETKEWEIEAHLTKKQQQVESYSYQFHIRKLTNERAVLKAKIKKIQSSHQNDRREFLTSRIYELKELKEQLGKDTMFIKDAQQLQIDKENSLSNLTNLKKNYDGLKERLTALQLKNFDSCSTAGMNESGSTSLASSDNDIFDKLTPQTNSTEKASRWRRFYGKGSLSPSSWSLRLNTRRKNIFRLLAN